jgi:hypothetical protein
MAHFFEVNHLGLGFGSAAKEQKRASKNSFACSAISQQNRGQDFSTPQLHLLQQRATADSLPKKQLDSAHSGWPSELTTSVP